MLDRLSDSGPSILGVDNWLRDFAADRVWIEKYPAAALLPNLTKRGLQVH